MKTGTKRHRTPEAIRLANPHIQEFWNISELVKQAGLHGLSTTANAVAVAIIAGRGPKVYAIAGSAVVIRPAEGERWIKAEIARRRHMQPTVSQRKRGVTEDNFASL